MNTIVTMDGAALIHGDCLSYMRSLPDGLVDLVFTSPPYEAARTYGIGFNARGDEWVEWAADRYMECLRVCRGLVAWVVEGQTDRYRWSAVPMKLAVAVERRGACLRKPPVFHRVGIPGSGGPDWLRNDYEFVVCATAARGKLRWSDNTAMGHPPKWGPSGEMSNRLAKGTRINQWGRCGSARGAGNKRADGHVGSAKRPSHVMMRVTPDVGPTGEARPNRSVPFPVRANPGNVIRCNVGGGAMGSRLAHENEAPFPERLAEFFVRSFCPPGGTVLDPFCGSGTTLAVAKQHGRRAIGVDIRLSQCDLSMLRVASVLSAIPDPDPEGATHD